MSKSIRLTAKEVKKIRKAMGMTQGEFGKAVDVPQSRVSEWENGVYRPSPRTTREILRIFEDHKAKNKK